MDNDAISASLDFNNEGAISANPTDEDILSDDDEYPVATTHSDCDDGNYQSSTNENGISVVSTGSSSMFGDDDDNGGGKIVKILDEDSTVHSESQSSSYASEYFATDSLGESTESDHIQSFRRM